jgi:pyrimidine operon attenuation protein/uracil phosphoribosyltransferase
MKVIMDDNQIRQSLVDLTDRIVGAVPDGTDIAAIGIRSRGEIIAQRLAKMLSAKLGTDVPCGTLDITLYRDDINDPRGQGQPTVRSTEIPFDINEKIIILVDDVLYTGRSTRAAMDALIDLGRPKAIRLAVLVDRGHHELPIQADFTARTVDIPPAQTVEVMMTETDGVDQVIVE